MRIPLLVALCSVAFAAGRSAMLAAPRQTTQQPGQMTDARMTVQNRGRAEAVPISLQEVALDAPLRVRLMNGEAAPGSGDPISVRVIREPVVWQYKSITFTANQNLAATLTAEGAGGWETTGIAFTNAQATTLLLKRLR